MACLLKTNSTQRRTLRHLLAILLVAGAFTPSQPAFAAAERAPHVHLHDQVYRFIEGAKGKVTARRFTSLILTSAKKHGLDPLLVANLILNESSFNPKAISPMGAIGLMQVMPFHYTKRRIPISQWHDPAINIDLGCQIYASYLAMMGKRYPELNASSLQHRALVAYNMGPRAVISRGIFRSRYSQKVSQKPQVIAADPRPSRPVPIPPPVARPEDAEPIRWDQLPLSTTALSVNFGAESQDPLRVGHALPETVFLRPTDPSDFLPNAGIERGTP
ncbi:Membrane-bound lytic murein transglycosylase C precursor [compost metagenome]